MDFLDFIRKVAQEKRERGYVIKGGPGSGWHAPPKGTHGKGKTSHKGKLLDFSKMSKEERGEAIRNLKPTDRLRLFHGTRDHQLAQQIIKDGFDPTKPPPGGRIYHGKLAPEKGFFVSPWREISTSFGRYVIEFETRAKDLVGPPIKDLPKGESLDDFWRSVYPDSFRPSLSHGLKLAESQGLLINKVPSKQVKAVWRYDRDKGDWYATKPDDFLREGD